MCLSTFSRQWEGRHGHLPGRGIFSHLKDTEGEGIAKQASREAARAYLSIIPRVITAQAVPRSFSGRDPHFRTGFPELTLRASIINVREASPQSFRQPSVVLTWYPSAGRHSITRTNSVVGRALLGRAQCMFTAAIQISDDVRAFDCEITTPCTDSKSVADIPTGRIPYAQTRDTSMVLVASGS